tara:strand:- start:286 stop:714 length:429 start_codon:yes stop_codon:yes gene_type:complete
MGILSTIRSQVSTKVAGVSGFHLSKQTPPYFGRTQNTIAHKSFVVDMATTNQANERQRRAVGVYCQSTLRVLFAYRLRPIDAYPVDYDLMLDAEESVINAVLSSYSSQLWQIRYESSSRAIPDSQEYAIITLEFTTLHTIQP